MTLSLIFLATLAAGARTVNKHNQTARDANEGPGVRHLIVHKEAGTHLDASDVLKDTNVQAMIDKARADPSTKQVVIDIEPTSGNTPTAPAAGVVPQSTDSIEPSDVIKLHAAVERGLKGAEQLVHKVEQMRQQYMQPSVTHHRDSSVTNHRDSSVTDHRDMSEKAPLPISPRYALSEQSTPGSVAAATNDIDVRVQKLEGQMAAIIANLTQTMGQLQSVTAMTQANTAKLQKLHGTVDNIEHTLPSPTLAPTTHRPTSNHKGIDNPGELKDAFLRNITKVPEDVAPCLDPDNSGRATIKTFPDVGKVEFLTPCFDGAGHQKMYNDRSYQFGYGDGPFQPLQKMPKWKCYQIRGNHISYKNRAFVNLTVPVSAMLYAFNDMFDMLPVDNATQEGWKDVGVGHSQLGDGPVYARQILAGTYTLHQQSIRHSTLYLVVMDDVDKTPCNCGCDSENEDSLDDLAHHHRAKKMQCRCIQGTQKSPQDIPLFHDAHISPSEEENQEVAKMEAVASMQREEELKKTIDEIPMAMKNMVSTLMDSMRL
ncbi:hypothetical protein AAMO2058_000150200 [Amorphochlora amoebiformis]